jgi:hypothetical protein
MTRGAYIFVAFVYLVLAASFLASTGLLIQEFGRVDWRAVVQLHSHLFLFFPIFGLLVLAAFYLPSVAFAHMYWYHVPYGRLRFIICFFVAVAISLGVSQLFAASELRGVWEISPAALRADTGVPANCASSRTCQRAPILATIDKLRDAGPRRVGLSEFARDCRVDELLPPPTAFKEERFCFPALRILPGKECCEAQARLRSDVAALRNNPRTRSEAADLDAIFLPLKIFFITVMLVVALMLAVWRDKIDTLYGPQVPAIERGVIIGAIAMLFWPIMDYGYQQTSDVMFGNYHGAFQPRWSLVIAPWAILLLFFFLRRFGKNLAMVGQIGGIAGALFAALRYQDMNNWAQRFLGGGAEQWMAYVYAGLAVIGLILLLWPRREKRSEAPT